MQVLIIGAGFGGISAAIELQRHGITDVTLLEKAPDYGGTWFHNTYPGCACDVPSHLYSFSYAQRRDWTRLCSPQSEIFDYLHQVARDLGVDRKIVTNAAVTACNWDDAARRWTVTTEDGATHEADALIIATGQLHQPSYPRVEGAETFAGHAFHSAQWDHDYDLAGKRVAVVGTGASAVQFLPEIAPQVAKLTVFQRTGNWFLPRKNRAYPPWFKALVTYVPGVQWFRRNFMFQYCESLTMAIRHPRTFGRFLGLRSSLFMRGQLRKHPELRRKVWPGYTFGCKRVLFSSHFLPALARPNVDVVTDAIRGMTAEGVVTADGRVHEVDCVIWGTGFKTMDFMFPMEVSGTEGRDLREVWAGGAHAHLGMTVPGFPNMFVMYGPNTNTSGGSIIWYEEVQAAYIRQALQLARRHDAPIEVRPEVEAASDREVQARFAGTAWTQCDSWYRDSQGRIVSNWPGYMRDYFAAVKEIEPSDFDLISA